MKVKIRLLQAVLELPELESVEPQEELEVEEWTARTLIRKGMAEPVGTPDLMELRRLILAEERSRELRELPEDFISKLSLTPGAPDQAQLLKAVEELMEIRVQKILAAFPHRDKNMLPEEVRLLNLIEADFEGWREELKRGINP